MRLNFRKVRKYNVGYNIESVDKFFEENERLFLDEETDIDIEKILRVSFPLSRQGYRPREVDSILERVAKGAVLKKRNAIEKDEWDKYKKDLFAELRAIAKKEDSKKFSLASEKQIGYKVKDVDSFISEFNFKDGKFPSPRIISDKIFRPVKGDKGYSEEEVDSYLRKAFILSEVVKTI
jgi:DivIVA domain-containing protein